jgi:hypothetical protein
MTAPDMGEPVNPWMMETGSFWIWGALAVLAIVFTLKDRRIPLFGLVLVAATSAFWQEFFGDWGAYLAWNPAFARLPFWGEMAFTTPVKPLFIPFSWGWWFALSIPLLVALTRWLNRRLPRLSTTLIALVIAMPLFLAYQINVEGSSVANGWWTYDVVIGPALESPKGRLPLVFPILLGLWAGLFVALLARRNPQGFMPHEIWAGAEERTAGWGLEWTRLWSMVAVFQVSFLVVNIAPAVIGRALFGGPSVLVP